VEFDGVILQDARAANHAKLMQTQSPPKDCEYDNLGFADTIAYFFRVHVMGRKYNFNLE
jgi:hypothetical protein